MHTHHVENKRGHLEDVVPFCSDACHREWCRAHREPYGGWNGCQDGSDHPEFCANCGVYAGGTPFCECQTSNVIVNRFLSVEGQQCPHGNWIQLPAERVA